MGRGHRLGGRLSPNWGGCLMLLLRESFCGSFRPWCEENMPLGPLTPPEHLQLIAIQGSLLSCRLPPKGSFLVSRTLSDTLALFPPILPHGQHCPGLSSQPLARDAFEAQVGVWSTLPQPQGPEPSPPRGLLESPPVSGEGEHLLTQTAVPQEVLCPCSLALQL